jgi:cell division protein FtsZ
MSPKNLFETQAIIKVVGVGGGGCNAVNRMVKAGLQGVEFVALNTDRQALEASLAHTKIPLGAGTTRGLGAGGDPGRGLAAAKESERDVSEILEGADLVFVTAGMGGGTGTGAAPHVAELARRLGVLTVGVVTRPFAFEGPVRKRNATGGLEALKEHTDTLIVIPNDNLSGVVDKRASLQDAFAAADDVLRQGVQGISDIVLKPGMINVDFADVAAVLRDAGLALMGIGTGVGEQRARVAAQAAATSALLETDIQGAKRLLVNVTSGPDLSLGEMNDAMEFLLQLTDAEEASITMGQVIDPDMLDEVHVTVLAAGMTGQVRRPIERDVFAAEPTPRRDPLPTGTRTTPKPIEVEELDLDIPSFLRRQRAGQ